jgi:hypothetical protein
MPNVHFRLRTIIFVIVMFATTMAMLSAALDHKLILFRPAATVVFIFAIVFVFAVIVEIIVFLVRLCLGQVRRWQLSTKVKR